MRLLRSRSGVSLHMTRALLLLAFCSALSAQTATPLSSGAIPWTPKIIVSGGGGFVSPNGKFIYASESTYIGAATWTTVATEQTLIHGQVTSSTLAGVTRALYQFGPVTVCITGLGGGSTSTSGSAGAAWSAQGCVDVRWGKTAYGNVVTAMYDSASKGVKVTLGFRWAQ